MGLGKNFQPFFHSFFISTKIWQRGTASVYSLLLLLLLRSFSFLFLLPNLPKKKKISFKYTNFFTFLSTKQSFHSSFSSLQNSITIIIKLSIIPSFLSVSTSSFLQPSNHQQAFHSSHSHLSPLSLPSKNIVKQTL